MPLRERSKGRARCPVSPQVVGAPGHREGGGQRRGGDGLPPHRAPAGGPVRVSAVIPGRLARESSGDTAVRAGSSPGGGVSGPRTGYRPRPPGARSWRRAARRLAEGLISKGKTASVAADSVLGQRRPGNRCRKEVEWTASERLLGPRRPNPRAIAGSFNSRTAAPPASPDPDVARGRSRPRRSRRGAGSRQGRPFPAGAPVRARPARRRRR